jgi:hypothetical protein
LRLPCELVPTTSWGSSLAKNLPPAFWQQLRQACLDAANNQCEICGAHDGTLEAHEIWSYDDAAFTQTLVRHIALCKPCHMVKHMARSSKVCTDEQFAALVEHFLQVNGCTRDDFERHAREVNEQMKARSQHDWTVVLPPEIEAKLQRESNEEI